LAPHRDCAPSRERKEKTAYKNRPGADTLTELCPLDPMIIGLELVSTSTLSITSQDTINNITARIKTLLTEAPKKKMATSTATSEPFRTESIRFLRELASICLVQNSYMPTGIHDIPKTIHTLWRDINEN
jgi:hypothetical protein